MLYDRPANDGLEHTSFASDINFDQPRVLRVVTAGTGSLVVVTAAGNERTFTVIDGEEIPVLVKVIKDTTDVDRVRSYIF